MTLQTPVALIIFNRPESAARVIQPEPSLLGRLYMFVHSLLKTTTAAPARKVLAFARSFTGIWH